METLKEFLGTLYQFDALIRWGGYTALVAIIFA